MLFFFFSYLLSFFFFFFFNDTATTEIYTLSLHDALPIFFLISWFSLLLLQLLRHLFYSHLKLPRQRYFLIVCRLMLVMAVFFIAFRWIHLSTPLIRLFLLELILLLKPTLNFLPVWFALSLLRFRLPSRLPIMFILWMVAMMVVIIPSSTEWLLTSFPERPAIMFMLVSWFGLT